LYTVMNDTLRPDARAPQNRQALAFAAAAVVLALGVGARFALAGRDTRSPRSAPTVHLTTGPTMTRFIQSHGGAYRVSSEMVTVAAITPTATATPPAISP
jgi:hypothetical protein